MAGLSVGRVPCIARVKAITLVPREDMCTTPAVLEQYVNSKVLITYFAITIRLDNNVKATKFRLSVVSITIRE